MSYQLLKLYFELFELQHILSGEILPLAAQVGLLKEDPALIQSAEKFLHELDRHLSSYQIELSKIKNTVKPFRNS